MTRLKSRGRGFSSVIGMLIMLALSIVTVASVLGLQAGYHSAVINHSQFILDKRQENFILVDSFPDGSKVRVMNRGPIAIQIVSVYVNHLLSSNVTSCQAKQGIVSPCMISPIDSLSSNVNLAWINTGAKLKFGDLLEVVSSRGNRVHAFFPVGRTGFSTSSNLYVGTGPLTIIFAPGSFNYTGRLSNGVQLLTPIDAWSGIPAGTSNTMFYLLIVNHGLGDIVLREESVFYLSSITRPASNVQLFCIADASSTPTTIIPYNRQTNPYIIPDNPNGDLALGGAPVLVKFAATGGSSCSTNGSVYNQAQVTAVLIGMIYYWNGDLYSQDIPLATLVVMGAPSTITLNPSSWFVGTPITVTGTGFAASSTVTIRFDGTTLSTNPITILVDFSGAFSATFSVPPTSLGIHTVTATDTVGNTASSSFTVLASVTQPITVTVANGGSGSGTGTLSGCSVYPTNVASDGSQHNFTAAPSCTVTVKVPSDSPPTRYRFSGLSTTVTVNTCSTGNCADPRLTVFYQLQNSYQITPLAQTTWDSGLSFTMSGTLSGSSGQTICTINPVGGSEIQSCAAYADYNTAVSFPANPTGQAANVRWQAFGALSFTDTTGGNTHNANYYKQFQLTLSYSLSGGGSPSPPIFTANQFGPPVGQILTITPTGYWFDSGAWSLTNPLGGSTASERWQTSQASGTVSSAQTIVFVYFHQFLDAFAYFIVSGGSPTAPTLTYTSLGSSSAATLSATSTSFWTDAGSAWSMTNPLVGSSATERWLSNSASGSVSSTTIQSVTVTYNHQFRWTLSYSVNGGGAPTAPTFTANQFGTPFSQILTTTATQYWFDNGASWSVTNPLSPSGASERWQTSLAPSGTISSPQTTAFAYYHQFLDSFAYSVLGGGSPTAPTLTYVSTASTSTGTLATLLTSFWIDAGSSWSTTNPLAGSSANERWQSNSASGSVTSTTTQSVTVFYYHQFLQTLSYSLVGGGSPSSPAFTANQFGSSFGQILTTSATGYWFDSGASWSLTNPLSASTASERWQTNQAVSGAISGTQTIVVIYYHQYLVTLQYNIANSPAGSGLSNPTATFSQFGTSTSDTATQIGPPSDWIDASSSVTYTNPLPGSNSTERWFMTTASFTVSGSTTLNPAYYHQLLMTLSYTVIGGGSPSAPTFTVGQFGSTIGQVLTTTPAGYFFDAASSWSINNPLGGSTSNQRWQTSQVTSGTVAVLAVNFQYNLQFLVHYAVVSCVLAVSVPADEWVNAAASATGVFPSQVTNNNGTRCSFVSDNRPSTITAPTTITGTYQTQFLVTYTYTGCSLAVSVPPNEWVNSGASATGVFPSTVTNGITTCNFLSDNRPGTVTAPTMITATYQ